MDAESVRLKEDSERSQNWKRWGPYLSERQWGTVREDYSASGDAWSNFTHEQSRSRAYRWGEDGILGITDRECRLCFGICLWNGRDSILKERLFGLTGTEGNHGEDVKEHYFYLESTPTHSYMKGLYKYPYEYPYEQLVNENRNRGKLDPEFEISDTKCFVEGRYFDVEVQYAKEGPEDILIKIIASNRGPDQAPLHILPTFWYRNCWIWGCRHEGCGIRPLVKFHPNQQGRLLGTHETLGDFVIAAETLEPTVAADRIPPYMVEQPKWLFTENDTNTQKLYGHPTYTPYVKDAFHEYLIHNKKDSVNPKNRGTKVTCHHSFLIPPGQSVEVRLRMKRSQDPNKNFFEDFDQVFHQREKEKDEFYNNKLPKTLTEEERNVAIQAFAGLLWSKQFYHYIVRDWLASDTEMPPPPLERYFGRNHDWLHLYNRDVISMPDKWEYPWYATWDLAFHCVSFALIDVEFAKTQLELFLREWYMHPNGALPAYEWDFGDVNPPVHAWACYRVYKESGREGERDVQFLKRVFQKLLMNFTWWVNRKDVSGKNIFAGGFLGLDNIGVFDRSHLPPGATLEQADGTAWMGFYCIFMLKIALELAKYDNSYEDIASKFFEHFVSIADAMNTIGGTGLWDEATGFYYDALHNDDQHSLLKVRSLVGIVPFFAIGNLPLSQMEPLQGFTKRTKWFLKNRPDLASQICFLEHTENEKETANPVLMLAIPNKERAQKVLQYLFDESEFLSDYGIRSVSKYHKDHPYYLTLGHKQFSVAYVPGESDSYLFGGNSNWRGPIWMPMNYVLLESLQRLYNFFGDTLTIDCPSGSGKRRTIQEAITILKQRLVNMFLPNQHGKRPVHGEDKWFAEDPHWKNLVYFYEYFHGDTGRGIGASHQTGWTALVANLICELGREREKESR